MNYYIVGIDGSSTPDPAYWAARNECIQANSPADARVLWIRKRTGWLRDDEAAHIKVEQVAEETFWPDRHVWSV